VVALRYFTGKPCKRGHLSERWVKTKICIACSRESLKKFRDENLESVRVSTRAQTARWRAANPGKETARAANWRANNPEKARETVREWARRNPDKRVAKEHRRRARKAGAGGSYTVEDLREIHASQRGRCAYCSTRVSPRSWHVDHIVALSRGGDNSRRNIQILCEPCNLSKGSRDALDFVRSRGGLI
jgi:5-methylcytosine-specific restriction endonuclease McrA